MAESEEGQPESHCALAIAGKVPTMSSINESDAILVVISVRVMVNVDVFEAAPVGVVVVAALVVVSVDVMLSVDVIVVV